MSGRFDPRVIFDLRVPRGSPEAYLIATAFVLIAALVRFGLALLGPLLLPFTTFYPALLFATYVGGLWVGFFAAIVGGLVGWWAFLPPHYAFFPISYTDELELLTYGLACAVIIWATDSYRRLADNYRGSRRTSLQ